jgi:Holliday junction resolvase-like predicted endonuclease
MMFVTKADGRKQPFYKDKVIRTCLRMHATQQQARAVADRVEKKVYDGITTGKILQMVFTFLKEYRPEIAHEIDLREAISLLRPKPDFENFVCMLLREHGYETSSAQLVKGKCIEHEIDGIAKKNGQIIYIEVKHHYQPHTYTGVSVCLETQAVFEDLVEGFGSGRNSVKFDKAMIVCNTKFSDHALQYAECRGILYRGWSAPADAGLEQMIEKKRLYPITFLKGLDSKTEEKFGDAGIVLLKQLVGTDASELQKKTKIPKDKIENLVKKAREILSA